MTKYRLNIKYPIEKGYGPIFKECLYYDGCTVDEIGSLLITDICTLTLVSFKEHQFHIPKSWIEEINEESAYDKWYDDNFKNDERLRNWTEEAWKASQENRDLLYKDLLNLLTPFLSIGKNGTNTINFNDIDKELVKIKKALPSNV